MSDNEQQASFDDIQFSFFTEEEDNTENTLKCPRTGQTLEKMTIGDITVDFSKACGGVWFDNYELEKFDEEHEKEGKLLADLITKYQAKDLDLEARIYSPVHPNTLMLRRFYSPKYKVVIDECPLSGGIWLDGGELAAIRQLFSTATEKKAFIDNFVKEMFDKNSEFTKMQKESREKLKKAKQIAHALRWITPSYYIPKKK